MKLSDSRYKKCLTRIVVIEILFSKLTVESFLNEYNLNAE
jgi:hypothetical protein